MGHIGEVPFRVLTTLAAYRIVAGVTGTANTVQYPLSTGVTQMPLGISTDTVRDTTGTLPVAGPGNVAKLFFNDTVTSGALVAADTSGRGIPFVAVTTSTCFVGVLLGATVAATGTIADVLIQPGTAAIP